MFTLESTLKKFPSTIKKILLYLFGDYSHHDDKIPPSKNRPGEPESNQRIDSKPIRPERIGSKLIKCGYCNKLRDKIMIAYYLHAMPICNDCMEKYGDPHSLKRHMQKERDRRNLEFQKLLEEHDKECEILMGTKETEKRTRKITKEIMEKVWERDKGRCVDCGATDNLQFDHIIPFSKGGSNSEQNIRILCQSCNLKKSDKIG